MTRRQVGPRRSNSIESYLRETRALALIALLALGGGITSDVVGSSFWERHGLIAGIASSVIVVLLSVALINEALERRRRRRWAVLAQYVLLGLVRNARLIWTDILVLADLMPLGEPTKATVDAGALRAQDTEALTAALRGVVADADRRRRLHDVLKDAVQASDQLLGRWAGVMLNADAYAEIMDRHVELASELFWLDGVLDRSAPDDTARRRAALANPAISVEGPIDDGRLVARVVTLTQLAESLDRLTLDVAMRVVPLEWWADRLGDSAPEWLTDQEQPQPEAEALSSR